MKENDSLATAPSQVAMGSLTAKEILKKVFRCTHSLTDDELLEQIRNVLVSDSATRIKSFSLRTKLISTVAGAFLQRFWSDLESLNETDREDVELVILSKLKQSAKVRRGGRPKGAKGQDTDQQIYLAAALKFLSCSTAAMEWFLNPTQLRKKTRKTTVYKFLRRYAVSIKQELANMNEGLASKIVRANVAIELAKRIVNPAL